MPPPFPTDARPLISKRKTGGEKNRKTYLCRSRPRSTVLRLLMRSRVHIASHTKSNIVGPCIRDGRGGLLEQSITRAPHSRRKRRRRRRRWRPVHSGAGGGVEGGSWARARDGPYGGARLIIAGRPDERFAPSAQQQYAVVSGCTLVAGVPRARRIIAATVDARDRFFCAGRRNPDDPTACTSQTPRRRRRRQSLLSCPVRVRPRTGNEVTNGLSYVVCLPVFSVCFGFELAVFRVAQVFFRVSYNASTVSNRL